jgi:hypothetical protein
MGAGMNPDPIAFFKFVGIFVSATLSALALGQLASCISHNILVGLAMSKFFMTTLPRRKERHELTRLVECSVWQCPPSPCR